MENIDRIRQAIKNSPGRSVVASWFRDLNESLAAEAKIAGLFRHKSSIGNAREFVIKHILTRILPDAFGVTSGEILSSSGDRSLQQDIVVYDRRFPLLRISDSLSLCPVESVVATIEVKSTLDAKSLADSLANSESVLGLLRLYRFEQNKLYSGNEAEVAQMMARDAPACCVFGLRGLADRERLRDRVQDWVDESPVNRCSVMLPAAIITPSSVGVSAAIETGLPIEMEGGYSIDNLGVRTSVGRTRDEPCIWAATNSDGGFGWLAATVMKACWYRLYAPIGILGARPAIDRYIPTPNDLQTSESGWIAVNGRWLSRSN